MIGDVTDKGIPAALVMASTRGLLRSIAYQFVSPGEVLKAVNQALCADIPQGMFVTRLYAVLDTATGKIAYANAGHNLPYHRTDGGISEFYATGMPLGLMPERHTSKRKMFSVQGTVYCYIATGWWKRITGAARCSANRACASSCKPKTRPALACSNVCWSRLGTGR